MSILITMLIASIILKEFLLGLRFLEKKRSSLIAYLDLFRRAGYKSIQFVGVDLKNSKYFFQSDNYNYPNLYQQIPQSQPDNRIHKTENKKYGSLIFSEILNCLNLDYFPNFLLHRPNSHLDFIILVHFLNPNYFIFIKYDKFNY